MLRGCAAPNGLKKTAGMARERSASGIVDKIYPCLGRVGTCVQLCSEHWQSGGAIPCKSRSIVLEGRVDCSIIVGGF